jgi:Protein of unknown function (DUF1059)
VNKRLHCDCGFEARAADEEGLVREVQRHAREAHNMMLSHHEVLLLAFRADLDINDALVPAPHPTTPQGEEQE